MALKETIEEMKELLSDLAEDLEKAAKGNCAAAQRVRTGSIRFTKISKVFRKESVAAEKGSPSRKKKR